MLDLGDKIKEARKAKGLSQEQLAKELGLKSKKIVTFWETGHTTPDIKKAAELCRLLDIPAAYFLYSDTDDPMREKYTGDDMAFLREYVQLSDTDKQIIIDIMRTLKSRTDRVNAFKDAQVVSDSALFIDKEDPSYEPARKKLNKLKSKKKKSFLKNDDIQLLLCERGYAGKIRILDLMMIFGGKKVPGEKLYADIEDILERSIRWSAEQ